MIYVAGPFFNDEQRTLMTAVELALDGASQRMFCPRLELEVTADSSQEEMNRAFEGNVKALRECDAVVAVMDYLLPANEILCLHNYDTGVNVPLALPDVGTVWEIGYAYAQQEFVPLIGVWKEPPKRLNLMLIQTFNLCLFSLKDFERFCECLSGHGEDADAASIDEATRHFKPTVGFEGKVY